MLAELDYLKPHFDAAPEDRADLLAFIASGRVEIVGGSYNEPNTNLTTAESTDPQRRLRPGLPAGGARRGPAVRVDAGRVRVRPGYPGLMAAAGLTSSSWARGPFHQWGPRRSVGDNTRMQFASEFEWLSPDGRGLLTAYMPNHYGAGWATQAAPDLAAAEQAAYQEFSSAGPGRRDPQRAAAGRRRPRHPVPLGDRHPPRLERPLHLAPVRHRAAQGVLRRGPAATRRPRRLVSPQTRDMNPVYPGKDVSYIDTKQGQRAAEAAVEDGERLGHPGLAGRGPLPGGRAWTRPGASWFSARTTTRSPAPRATRCTWTCWRAGGRRQPARMRPASRRRPVPGPADPHGRPPRPGAGGGPGGRGVEHPVPDRAAGLTTVTLDGRRTGAGPPWSPPWAGDDGAAVPFLAEGAAAAPTGAWPS